MATPDDRRVTRPADLGTRTRQGTTLGWKTAPPDRSLSNRPGPATASVESAAKTAFARLRPNPPPAWESSAATGIIRTDWRSLQ